MSLGLRPVVLCGPSGCGKSTIMKKLMEEFGGLFGFSVSHTTRGPRPDEIEGVHYYFSSIEEMEQMKADGEFVEFATFSGNLYGTSKAGVKNILESGRICILDIDVQGVKSVKQTDLNPWYVFIMPPSLSVLEHRLRSRGTETEDAIVKRLSSAAAEMEYGNQEGNFDIIIINEDLDDAYEKLKTFLKPEMDKITNKTD